jgi:hypothetical protein
VYIFVYNLSRVSVGEHLHCATVEFEVQFCICITPVGDNLSWIIVHMKNLN